MTTNPLPSSNVTIERLEPRQLLAAGDLDRSFGTRGVVLLDDDTAASELIVLPDGKFLVSNGTGVRRFNNNGSLDSSFGGGDGLLPRTPGLSGSLARASNGKLYMIGASGGRWFLARFNADGTADTSFGNNGEVIVRIGDDHDEGGAKLAIAPSGKIVAAGYQDNDNDDPDNTTTPREYVAVAVFNPNGTPDTSFGGDGEVDELLFNNLQDLAVAANGNILVAGQFQAGHNHESAFYELSPTGAVVEIGGEISNVQSIHTAAAYRPDNTRVIASSATGFSSVTVGDTNTGIFFRPTHPNRVVDNYILDVRGTSDNKTLVAGFTGGTGRPASGLVRLNPDGTPDKTFGFGGFTTIDFMRRGNDWLTNLAVFPDGDILAAGYAGSTQNAYEPPSGGRLFLARFEGGSRTVGDRRPIAATYPSLPRAGDTKLTFEVVYAAEDVVNAATLGNRDIRVLGPRGFRPYARLVDTETRYDGRHVQATYEVDAPGGAWDAADNGRYSIILRRRAVRDNFGHAVAASRLARFVFRADSASPAAPVSRSATPSTPAATPPAESLFSSTKIRDEDDPIFACLS